MRYHKPSYDIHLSSKFYSNNFCLEQCDELVNEYVAVIMDELAKMSPQELCYEASLCPKPSVSTAQSTNDQATLLFGGEPRAVGAPNAPVTEERSANGAECTLCKEVVKSVEDKLVKRTRVRHLNSERLYS